MTIQEAVRSGRPFRLPRFEIGVWYRPEKYATWIVSVESGPSNIIRSRSLSMEDIMSDEWEILPE